MPSAKGAFQGQYEIVITVEGEQAERSLAALAGVAESSGSTLDQMGLRVHKLGGGLEGLTPVAVTNEEKMVELARSLSTVTGPLGQMIQQLPGVDAGLLSSAVAAAGAGLALGGLVVAVSAAYAISSKAAQSYADQALALEAAARAANKLTPEITANADRARQYDQTTQKLGDEWNQFTSDVGELLIPALQTLDGTLSGIIKLFDNLTQSDLAQWLTSAMGSTSLLYTAMQVFNNVIGTSTQTTGEQTRALQAAKQAQDDYNNAVKQANQVITDADNAAIQYANDVLAVEQADLRAATVQADWDAKVAAAAEARRKAIDDANKAETQAAKDVINAKKSVADAEQNVTDVERRSATAIVDAKQKVADIEARLRNDQRVDVQSARSVADAKLRLARVEQDIASGRLSGVDATRAYEDASQGLQRVQEDAAQANVDHQARIEQDQRDLANARQHVRDVEVQADRDIKAAKESVRTTVERLNTAETKYSDAVKETARASQTAGISAAERQRHELDVQAAVLASAEAHRRLNGDIATMAAQVKAGNWQWEHLKSILTELHVTQFPAIMKDLQAIKNINAPYSGDDGAARRDALNTSRGGNTVNVTINGVIADKNAANAIGAAVADGVHKQFLRWQNAGQDLGIGRGRH